MARSFLRITAALTVLVAVAAPQTLLAQGSLREQTQRTAAADGPSQVFSINPFLPLAGYFQAEYEKRLQDNLAFAISGSYVRFDDYYTNLDAKVRLYPQERALQGVGLAAGLGFGAIRRSTETVCDPVTFTCADRRGRTESAPTFSVEGHYQWLLGSRRATAITLGLGGKRYFLSPEKAEGIERFVPTARLTIGYAFR